MYFHRHHHIYSGRSVSPLTWKMALRAGSSQQGKHLLASSASNCVEAITRDSPSTVV